MRKLTPDDAEVMYALNLDPDVIRYTGDLPFESIQATRLFLLEYAGRSLKGVGRMAVVEKQSGEVIGWCGLKYHPDEEEYDVGYRFFKKYWNKGYATETASACLTYAFEVLQLPFVVGNVMRENTASIRVLEKIGMDFWKERCCGSHPALVYRVDAT